MKHKFWLYQIPIVLLFTGAFGVVEWGELGNLHSNFLRNNLFPPLRSMSGAFTNLKFKIRGTQKPKNKVVIVEIDDQSVLNIGRWPWHRDIMAQLVEKIFDAGARTVGLDIVFSEHDQRVPNELAEYLKAQGFGDTFEVFETDPVLASAVARFRNRTVMGWLTDSDCQPAYQDCPVTHPDVVAEFPENFDKFAIQDFQSEVQFDPLKTPLISALYVTPNLPSYTAVAKHAGYFNIKPDSDGYVRRVPLVFMANGRPYPSLALEMARVALNEDLEVKTDSEHKIASIRFKKSGRLIPTSPLGTMKINFKGPARTYPYVSALDLLVPPNPNQPNRTLASTANNLLLKDAYVFIGPSALGIFDMRAFPFDTNVPGVEGHATILDNILSNDMLVDANQAGYGFIMLLLMIAGALTFAYFTDRFEAVPALILFVLSIAGFGFIDIKILFENNLNLNSGFLYVEVFTIFILTVAAKYILEEKNKKFLKGAFGKYVSPALVDQIVKNPDSFSLGGEKQELTIMFSDIRGFTTLSEKMDAKALTAFLNDYLGLMSNIIYETEGTLDKYIGDAVMAFWGAPIVSKRHGFNACDAAVRMMSTLEKERPRFVKEYGIDVQIGIGINSGNVSVGNMGSDNNFNYTVIGDHVNLASRLEGLTKYYGASIVTSRFTIDQIKASKTTPPKYRTLDFVKVKGKKQAVELIQIMEENKLTRKQLEEGLNTFEEAREFYSQQKWDEAIKKFRKASDLLRTDPDGHDGPSYMYIDRCNEFKANPPGEDWDGSWQMTTK